MSGRAVGDLLMAVHVPDTVRVLSVTPALKLSVPLEPVVVTPYVAVPETVRVPATVSAPANTEPAPDRVRVWPDGMVQVRAG